MDINTYNIWLKQEYEKTKDIGILERYVVSETISPIADYNNAITIIRENYPYQINSTLLIIGAYLTSEWTFGNNELLDILNNMYKYLPAKEKAIVCYLNAHYLRFRDEKYSKNPVYQKNLIESLNTEVKFVNNRVYLADLYTKDEAIKMLNEALSNVIQVYSSEDIESMTEEQFVDPQAFINEHILGTHLSYVVFEVLDSKREALQRN